MLVLGQTRHGRTLLRRLWSLAPRSYERDMAIASLPEFGDVLSDWEEAAVDKCFKELAQHLLPRGDVSFSDEGDAEARNTVAGRLRDMLEPARSGPGYSFEENESKRANALEVVKDLIAEFRAAWNSTPPSVGPEQSRLTPGRAAQLQTHIKKLAELMMWMHLRPGDDLE